MSEPLGTLFEPFLKERICLKAVTPKTRSWHLGAWNYPTIRNPAVAK